MLKDLRHAVRMLLHAKGWTAVVIVSLALGIGANAAIFSGVNALLLTRIPVDDPGSLVRLRYSGRNDMVTSSSDYGYSEKGKDGQNVRTTFSYPMYQQFLADNKTMTELFAFAPAGRVSAVVDGQAEIATSFISSGNYYQGLGVKARLGRTILPEDDKPTAPPVAVISSKYWHTRFQTDPAVLGKTMRVNNVMVTIVGVLEPAFTGVQQPVAELQDIGLPLALDPQVDTQAGTPRLSQPTYWWLQVMGRLKPGATAQQVQGNLEGVFRATARAGMDEYLKGLTDTQRSEARNRNRSELPHLLVDSARHGVYDVGSNELRSATILSVVVALVLLIVCANVANLLLSRATTRQRELSVRLSLGATRGRLVRQLLTESLLLAGVGGILSLAVAHWTVKAIVALAPATIPRLEESALDLPVLVVTAALSLVTGLLFGVLPAWTAATTRVADVARASGRTTAAGARARSALMVVETALALLLVIGAGLLLRSFYALTQQPLGFDSDGLVTANITFNGQRYFDVGRRTRIFDAFEERMASAPGVTAVALTTDLPIGGSPIFHNLAFEGRPMATGTEPEVYYRGVNAGYFDALGIPFKRGRKFTAADRAGAPLVAIVNEAFVREYYPTDNPLGRRIQWVSGNGNWITIVGVAADVRGLSLESGEVPAVYVPYRQEQAPWRMWMDVAVRCDAGAAATVKIMRQELVRLDPAVPLTKAGTMTEVLARSVASRRFNLFLLGGFATLSLFLAAAGTYGVMSFAVAQRTREMGVRLALGARPVDLMRLVVGHGLVLTGVGVAVGLAGAVTIARIWGAFLATMLFQVRSTDLPTLAAGAAVLLAAAAAAAYLPARRAARVDPLIALRSE